MRLDLWNKSIPEIITAFQGLPSSVARLDLSGNDLWKKSAAELAMAFQGLPSSVATLNLSWNGFWRKSGAELATAFQGLPSSVATLGLSGNQLWRKSSAELAIAFQGLPASVATLNLSRNGLGEKSGAELATAFQGLPSSVATLNLSGNDLCRNSGAELATAFQGLPSSVVTLELSWSELWRKSGAELATAFQGLSPSVTTLNLSRNELGSKSGAELATVFQALSPSVTILHLSENELWGKGYAELAIAFQGLPSSVVTLDLCENDLWRKSGAELATAFQGLPASVATLDLSGNDLWKKSAAELAIAFQGLPSSVATLNLSWNGLWWNKSGAELATVFQGLPSSVTMLDLSDNVFGGASQALEESLASLEQQDRPLRHIVLRGNRLFPGPFLEMDAKFKRLMTSRLSLDLEANGLNVLSRVFPAFLRQKKSNVSYRFLGLPFEVQALIFDFIAPVNFRRVCERRQDSALVCFQQRYPERAHAGAFTLGALHAYLSAPHALSELKRVEASLTEYHAPKVSSVLKIMMGLEQLKVALGRSCLPGSRLNECIERLKTLTRQFLCIEEKLTSELREQFTRDFKTLESLAPPTLQSILITLAIACTGIGLLFLAGHYASTQRFFVCNERQARIEEVGRIVLQYGAG